MNEKSNIGSPKNVIQKKCRAEEEMWPSDDEEEEEEDKDKVMIMVAGEEVRDSFLFH